MKADHEILELVLIYFSNT